MKKLILVLAVASMFIASTAMAAIWIPSLNGTKATGTAYDLGNLIEGLPDSVSPPGDTNPGSVTGPAGYVGMQSSDFTFSADFVEFVAGVIYPSGMDGVVYQTLYGSFTGAPLPFTPGTSAAPTDTPLMCMDGSTANFAGVNPPPADVAIWGIDMVDTDGSDGVVSGMAWVSLDGFFYTGVALAGFDFTLTQVPIPGALYLLGSGLIGLIGIRRRMFA